MVKCIHLKYKVQSSLTNAYNCVTNTPIKTENMATTMLKSSRVLQPSHPSPTRQPLICYHPKLVFLVLELLINETVQCALFCAWHLSLSLMLIF